MKASNSQKIIYLDNAATSWPKPEGVAQSIAKVITEGCANPGRSGHKLSIDTARMIFSVRDSLSGLLGARDPLSIAFAYNATSALNTAIMGLIHSNDHVITCSMEHNSVMRPLKLLEKQGLDLTIIECSSDGSLDPMDIRKAITPKTKAVIITHASNVTGTIMPIDEISIITKEAEIPFIVDGSQTVGTIHIDVLKSGIDFFAFTGHKGLLGPQGTGGFYIKESLIKRIKPFFTGGTGSNSEEEVQPDYMPDKYESGTPNTPGIIGLGQSVDFINKTGIDTISNKEKVLTKIFLDEIKTIRNIKIYGKTDVNGRTSVISLNINGITSSEVSYRLDEEFRIMTRPGLHCAPTAHRTIGSFPEGTVRFSIGYFNTEDEILQAVKALKFIAGE